jgi:hypothetical protein
MSDDDLMTSFTYTPDKPPLAETSEQLRARVPGWGADLDPADRPSVPRERFDPGATGAHWRFPERQPERWPRERSIEHAGLTPVFGTAQPPKGASGAIRRHAYRRYSEGRTAHWLLLVAADRVDVVESVVGSTLRGRPENPMIGSGLRAELRHHGISARVHARRADKNHQWLDPLVVAGPWLLGGYAGYRLVRWLVGHG